ncbi:MAG: hypothetical protein JOZ25_12205, partial [Actinobacteria bacterium]|nr:hypothetical protein [Actinomycetota bacterium]
WRRARTLITDNRPLLDAFAHHLLANEVLEREDIEQLLEQYRAGELGSVEDAEVGGNGSGRADQVEPGVAQLAAAERLESEGSDPR